MDYSNILDALAVIEAERKSLEEASRLNQYSAHIKLPETFDELLINLKRDIALIDEKIKVIKRNITNNLFIKGKKESTDIDLDIILDKISLALATNDSEKLDYLKADFINKHLNYKDTIEELIDLIRRRQTDESMFNYIRNLQINKEKLLKAKRIYEKKECKGQKFR